MAPSKSTSQTDPTQTKPSPPQNQTALPELVQAPQTEPELQREPQPDQDTKRLTESSPDLPSEPELKPGPKTRGKMTPTKKKTALTATRPVRQTRYQTRRQQQQPSLEPEPVSRDSSEPYDLEKSDPGTGSGSQPEENEAQVIEVTPETLGLPSDMTALNFDYDFNFD